MPRPEHPSSIPMDRQSVVDNVDKLKAMNRLRSDVSDEVIGTYNKAVYLQAAGAMVDIAGIANDSGEPSSIRVDEQFLMTAPNPLDAVKPEADPLTPAQASKKQTLFREAITDKQRPASTLAAGFYRGKWRELEADVSDRAYNMAPWDDRPDHNPWTLFNPPVDTSSHRGEKKRRSRKPRKRPARSSRFAARRNKQ